MGAAVDRPLATCSFFEANGVGKHTMEYAPEWNRGEACLPTGMVTIPPAGWRLTTVRPICTRPTMGGWKYLCVRHERKTRNHVAPTGLGSPAGNRIFPGSEVGRGVRLESGNTDRRRETVQSVPKTLTYYLTQSMMAAGGKSFST